MELKSKQRRIMTKTANWKDLLHKTIFLVGEIIHIKQALSNPQIASQLFMHHKISINHC